MYMCCFCKGDDLCQVDTAVYGHLCLCLALCTKSVYMSVCLVCCYSKGDHICQVHTALYGSISAARWTELPSYCHSQSYEPGRTVSQPITPYMIDNVYQCDLCLSVRLYCLC